ncbi:MAG: ABC transporter permease [Patescibacteria group bacterium]
MKYEETFKTATVALRANKVRSFLTTLGVIIGVFSVVSLVSIGQGMQNYITDRFNALGSNLLMVSPGQVDLGDDPAKYLTKNKLGEKHIELIETHGAQHLAGITPQIRVGQKVIFKTNSYNATINGGNEQALNVFNFELNTGRKFTKADISGKEKVAILGNTAKQELFGSKNPIGETIEIGTESYEVIGTFKEKGMDFDDVVMTPYTSIMETLEIDNFSNIGTKVISNEQVNIAKREIELALLRDLDDDDFTVISQEEILGSIQNILQILTIGLGAIAGISLLVGGIGIMNIMLVSVTERTREIGLRKALGATNNDVAVQFLIESILLSSVGGIVGLILGYLLSVAAKQFVETALPLSAVFVAFGFAVFVGIIFGTYPAIKASKKNPIEALRYE